MSTPPKCQHCDPTWTPAETGGAAAPPPGVPRRACEWLRTPAERTIADAMRAVEEAGCDPRLTDAVTLLDKALGRVADFVDAVAPAPVAAEGPSTLYVVTQTLGNTFTAAFSADSAAREYAEWRDRHFAYRSPHRVVEYVPSIRLDRAVEAVGDVAVSKVLLLTDRAMAAEASLASERERADDLATRLAKVESRAEASRARADAERAAREKAERLHRESSADLLAVATALGCVNEADGHNPWPGTRDELVGAVKELQDELGEYESADGPLLARVGEYVEIGPSLDVVLGTGLRGNVQRLASDLHAATTRAEKAERERDAAYRRGVEKALSVVRSTGVQHVHDGGSHLGVALCATTLESMLRTLAPAAKDGKD